MFIYEKVYSTYDQNCPCCSNECMYVNCQFSDEAQTMAYPPNTPIILSPDILNPSTIVYPQLPNPASPMVHPFTFNLPSQQSLTWPSSEIPVACHGQYTNTYYVDYHYSSYHNVCYNEKYVPQAPLDIPPFYQKIDRFETSMIRYEESVGGKSAEAMEELIAYVYKVAYDIAFMYGYLKGSRERSGRPILLTLKSSCRSPGLETVWQTHFQLLFGLLEGKWTLLPSDSPVGDSGVTTYKDMAKVRFSCGKCGRGWTSMFGVVVFSYKYQHHCQTGTVSFKLMGQSCMRCKVPTLFETPMWYPEEAEKVLTNLFYSVCSKVFYQVAPPPCRIRRRGKPRNKHNAEQCQGCYLHICKEAKKTQKMSAEVSVTE